MAAKDKVFMGIRGRVPGRSGRSVGSPPELGKIARMPRKYSFGRSRRKGSRTATTAAPLLKLVPLMLGAVVLAIAIGLWISSRSDIDNGLKGKGGKNQQVVRVVGKYPAPSEESALHIVRQALASRSADQVQKFIRVGESKVPDIIAFLSKIEALEGKLGALDWWSGMDANGLQLEGVLVHFGEDETKSGRLALLTPDEDGVWRMDYDAFVRRVQPEWSKVLSLINGEAKVRVMIARDGYFNGNFTDETTWKCFKMASPDVQDTAFYGYVKLGSSQHIALESVLGGKTHARAVLRLVHEGSMSSQQFEILQVLAEDWVESDKVFDRKFTPSPGLMGNPNGTSGG